MSLFKRHPEYDPTFIPQLKKLALPVALQGLMLAAVGAGDAAMLGFIEQDAMSAVAQAGQIAFVQHLFLGCLTGGATVMGAQYWGKKDTVTVEKLFGLVMLQTLAISILFFLGSLLVPTFLMRLYSNDAHIIAIGADYLRVAAPSYLLVAVSQTYMTFMKLTGDTKRSAIIGTSAVILDAILNAVFIFGFHMGAVGAALTTVISRLVEVVLCLPRSPVKLAVRHIVRPTLNLLREFWKHAWPLFTASMAWGIGTTLYSVFMGQMGADATAASAVANIVKNLMVSFGMGISTGGGILLGNVLGANQLEKGKEYGIRLSRMSIVCGLICAALVLATMVPFSYLMDLTDTARSYLRTMLLSLALFMVGRAINDVTIMGVFTAGGDTKFDFYSLVATMWGIILPSACLATFVFHASPVVVFGILHLDEVIKLPWVYHHFKRFLWVRNITVDHSND